MLEPSPLPLSEVHVDGRDSTFRAQAHETLDALRETCPVHRDLAYDRIVLTRAVDVEAALNDRSLSSDPSRARATAVAGSGTTGLHSTKPGSPKSSTKANTKDRADRAERSLLHRDAAEHGRLRKPIVGALQPRAVGALRPRIERAVAARLDAIPTDRPFELVAHYASPVPVSAMAALLGIDEVDVAHFEHLAAAFRRRPGPDLSDAERYRIETARGAMSAFLAGLIAQRRKQPGEDAISALLAAQPGGDGLSDAEALGNSLSLLVAGQTCMTDFIGNCVVALLRHPDQLDRLRTDPARWPVAIEELLRFDPPNLSLQRWPVREHEIAGCPLEAGQTVTSVLLAANHDPALHANPHHLDIGRPSTRHFAFGAGPHVCPGAGLARIEAQVAVSALFERFPALRLVDDIQVQQKHHAVFRGYDAVWLSAM